MLSLISGAANISCSCRKYSSRLSTTDSITTVSKGPLRSVRTRPWVPIGGDGSCLRSCTISPALPNCAWKVTRTRIMGTTFLPCRSELCCRGDPLQCMERAPATQGILHITAIACQPNGYQYDCSPFWARREVPEPSKRRCLPVARHPDLSAHIEDGTGRAF